MEIQDCVSYKYTILVVFDQHDKVNTGFIAESYLAVLYSRLRIE